MYIPKFKQIKDRFNTVSKYKKRTILHVIIMYLKFGVSNREIDNIILNLDSPGYESTSILEYYGVTTKHQGIFKELTIDSMIDELSKGSEPNLAIIELLENSKTMHSSDEIFSDISKEDSYHSLEIEAYFNAEMRLRNRNIQSKLRAQLLIEFGCKCCLCDVQLKDLLVASHIIPYSQCNSDVAIVSNPNNALLLCVMHDKLFESSNHISINNCEVIIGNEILSEYYTEYKLVEKMFLNQRYINNERFKFLEEHYKLFKVKHKNSK